MAYLNKIFLDNIDKNEINIIFELGSRDLHDAIKLYNYYDEPIIHAFECNPDCLKICNETLENLTDNIKKNIILVSKAICIENKEIAFYPFDLSKYDNMGASSMLKIDFSNRATYDLDLNRPNPQKEIMVQGIRLDDDLMENNIGASGGLGASGGFGGAGGFRSSAANTRIAIR